MRTRGSSEVHLTYAEAGVDEPREQEALKGMLDLLQSTYSLHKGIGSPAFPIGHFSNVLDMGAGLGLVLTTDGVGTKLVLAQMLHKYDTVGIDCVANNVNDLLCLGAEPVAMLDYIAIDTIDEKALVDVARGLRAGAELAHISIPGGEIAQVADMLSPTRGASTIDLVGSAIGIVSLSGEREDLPPLVDGKKVAPGDVLIGLLSSGLHSNGYSFARKVLLNQAGLRLDQYVSELGRTLGEELLQPTFIYVDPVLGVLKKRLAVHGIVNVSGGGLLSLGRLPTDCGFLIKEIPPAPAVFRLIQRHGSIPDADMFAAFNMGIGFCLVCAKDAAKPVIHEIASHGYRSIEMGKIVDEPRGKIVIEPLGLVGSGEVFTPA